MLRYLSNHLIFDEELFTNFTKEITQELVKKNDDEVDEYLKSLCFSQDPIQNEF